jgi:hypothetical protein
MFHVYRVWEKLNWLVHVQAVPFSLNEGLS